MRVVCETLPYCIITKSCYNRIIKRKEPKGQEEKTMAKIKMTRKAITQNFINIRCAGFCDLQNLLSNHEPGAYTCGVYGWNFDVYGVYGVTLCTGYRRMPGKLAEGI